jgi:hypothetical protein
VIKYLEGQKPSWKCVARGCDHKRQGHAQLDRILKHSTQCQLLRESDHALWQEAVILSRNTSLSAQLDENSDVVLANKDSDEPPQKKQKGQMVLDVSALRLKGKKEKEEQRKIFQSKADHLIMRLICTRGLVPRIVDSPEWKELMGLLNGQYHPTSTDAFANKHIPSEAVYVREKQIEILRDTPNLTLTFDGNTIRKPHSIYTVHATTPEQVSYFLDGHEGSGERHTKEWITNKLLMVCNCLKICLIVLIINPDYEIDWF